MDNKKDIWMQTKINQPKGVKRKMTERKLRNCVNWPEA